MADIKTDLKKSIEQLTASLQELTASRANNQHSANSPIPEAMSSGELVLSKDVESFVQKNRDYADRTRSISVGTY
jgi:hypothetical protein